MTTGPEHKRLAGEQRVVADDRTAAAQSAAERSRLDPVLDGLEAYPEMEAEVGHRDWVGRAPLGTAGLVLGVASVVANMAYNCWTCGWDPHDAHWYEVLLVAGVPLLAAPILILVGLAWALVARTRRVVTDVLLMTFGMALPWIYWMMGSQFFR